MRNFGARIAGTIVAGTTWLAFIVLYLAFFADAFDFWQKLAVFIASGAVLTGVVAIIWVRWVLRD